MSSRTKSKEDRPFTGQVISLDDYFKQKAEWDAYREKVGESEAYRLYLTSRQAWKDGKGQVVKECAEKARKMRENEEDQTMAKFKPLFPDPVIEKASGRLRIAEDWAEKRGNPFAAYVSILILFLLPFSFSF